MSTYDFDGKVAVVTGAGGGLGREYAKLLAARGARVLVNDLGGSFSGEGADAGYAAKAAAEIRDLGGTAEANGDSVATAEGAKSIIADAMRHWGQVDILVNNAGIVSGSASLENMTDEQWDRDMAVAAAGTFYLCREVWGQMKARNYGRIVNVCSGSWFGMGTGVSYPAAKGAVWAITRSLGATSATRGWNIRANCIMPIAGSRMTELMGEEINALMNRDFPPKAVAPVVAMLAHESVPCNGEMFSVGGGGFARVFAGVSRGYRGTDKDWTLEDAFANFDQAFSTADYEIPRDAMADAEMYVSDVPWGSFRDYFE